MSTSLVERSRRLLDGEAPPAGERTHPLHAYGVIEEVTTGIASVSSFANVAVIDTGAGLALVDTGGPEVFDAEAEAAGRPRPRVIAHEAIDVRFDRYCLTAGYNGAINRRQFSNPGLTWPTEYRRPDDTYTDRFVTRIGEVTLELHHARGETDDHTWVWVPERRTLCTGDLFIWCLPNAGNPQKVQRFARDWAVALRSMAALEPEVLLPGHGLPIVGADRVAAALGDTAELLDSLVDQTLALMNAGVMLDEIIHTVQVPDHLTTQPYLQPVYDEPEFLVRNIWRLYGGWYDGNPARLKPAPDTAVATEIASLAGGAGALAERAEAVAATGDLRLAGHLIEYAGLAAPHDPTVHRLRADLLERRARAERSLMAKGIFGAAARDSAAVVAEAGDPPSSARD